MIHPGDMAGKGPLGLKGAKPRRDRGHMARVAALPCVCCGDGRCGMVMKMGKCPAVFGWVSRMDDLLNEIKASRRGGGRPGGRPTSPGKSNVINANVSRSGAGQGYCRSMGYGQGVPHPTASLVQP